MRVRVLTGAALSLLLIACGTDSSATQPLEPDHGSEVTVVSNGEAARPVGGRTVGAGHVVLHGVYGEAPDGSGELWRSREIVDVDLRTGATRWLEVPADLTIAEALATPSGLIVVGGPCSRDDVVSASEADDLWCPEKISESYLMDWETGTWSRLDLPAVVSGDAPYPYLEGGGLVGHDDHAYVVLRTSPEKVAILLRSGGEDWTHLTDAPAGGLPPCATSDGLVIHERSTDLDDLDQVTRQRIRLVRRNGETTLIAFPPSVHDDSFGGMAASVGCLDDAPVIIHGGPAPSAEAPVAIVAHRDATWMDVPLDSPKETAGGLPSRVESNDGSVTLGLASSGDRSIVRDAYLLLEVGEGARRIGSVESQGDGTIEGDPSFSYDELTDSLVTVTVSGDSTLLRWSDA